MTNDEVHEWLSQKVWRVVQGHEFPRRMDYIKPLRDRQMLAPNWVDPYANDFRQPPSRPPAKKGTGKGLDKGKGQNVRPRGGRQSDRDDAWNDCPPGWAPPPQRHGTTDPSQQQWREWERERNHRDRYGYGGSSSSGGYRR
jgi:hypothetical protein